MANGEFRIAKTEDAVAPLLFAILHTPLSPSPSLALRARLRERLLPLSLRTLVPQSLRVRSFTVAVLIPRAFTVAVRLWPLPYGRGSDFTLPYSDVHRALIQHLLWVARSSSGAPGPKADEPGRGAAGFPTTAPPSAGQCHPSLALRARLREGLLLSRLRPGACPDARRVPLVPSCLRRFVPSSKNPSTHSNRASTRFAGS